MKKNENTYIRLGLEKDTSSGELQLCIQFDNNAPNFTTDKDTTYWRPSFEEWEFAKDAFDLIWKGQGQNTKTTGTSKQDHNVDFKEQPPLTESPHIDDKGFMDKVLEKNKKT